MTDNPVLVEARRGGAVESRHRGAFVVTDADGKIVLAAGDVDAPVFPRSAVKPLQALALVESGAAAAFGLTDTELALACASHRGEPAHVAAVSAWLARIGLDESALECGAHLPSNHDAADALIRAGAGPTQVHNNCSGKHTGFLCTAVHLGEDPRGYIRREHPVQRRVAAAIADMTGADLDACPCGTDGCGIPSYALPLRALARGMARMADGTRPAATALLDAMAAEPFFVGGTGTFVTDAMTAAAGTVRVKTGAEGVYMAALPGLGYGVALKIDDGATRASDLAIATLLHRFGCFTAAEDDALSTHLRPTIRNVAGLPVGDLRPAEALTGSNRAKPLSAALDPATLPPGTYLNTGDAARRGLRVNRFCYDLRHPENRATFERDPEAAMAAYALSAEERTLIRAKDWLGLIHRGANVFPLLRLAQLCGDGLIATGAQMRGETVEQYLATRNLAKSPS